MRTSIFDIFKIGIGPSSSHTVGPMRAALAFVTALRDEGLRGRTARVCVELYGSLALTGIGHGTDRAVLLGLAGLSPQNLDPDEGERLLLRIREAKSLPLGGGDEIPYDEATDLVWRRNQVLAGHPNGMRCLAFDANGDKLKGEVYYSIGGGFIRREGEAEAAVDGDVRLPYPFGSARELLQQARDSGLPVWELVRRNETMRQPGRDVAAGALAIWKAMNACIERGLRTEGILPGGLKVKRRAPRLHARLQVQASGDPLVGMDWVNVFAMAVNEENAAGGRVVTAPTNGASGLIPAVIRYYVQFVPGADEDGIVRFLLAAGAIGVLYKENASISGAEVGCQGEVGVACSMAAAGLVAALRGSAEELEHAAEIGMEHHLGMTCDPIGGLVQIPCIERNAIGAMKAINASRMAMQETGEHKVSLDQVIKTMFETGRDMQSRYKETSLAGLAVNVVEC
ncbi:MAG: L-serine ammonia-lyase [Solimonas sp.]